MKIIPPPTPEATAYPPLVAHALNANSLMFVVEVIVWAAVWRIASRIIFKSNAFLLTLHAATPKQANKAKFEKNVAALVHATFATLTAVYYLPWLTQWDVAEKYNCGDFWHTWHQVRRG